MQCSVQGARRTLGSASQADTAIAVNLRASNSRIASNSSRPAAILNRPSGVPRSGHNATRRSQGGALNRDRVETKKQQRTKRELPHMAMRGRGTGSAAVLASRRLLFTVLNFCCFITINTHANTTHLHIRLSTPPRNQTEVRIINRSIT